jgi:hypothetical protein
VLPDQLAAGRAFTLFQSRGAALLNLQTRLVINAALVSVNTGQPMRFDAY